MQNVQNAHKEIIAVHDTSNYAIYRIPGILALSDGAMLLCCEARTATHGDWGDIDIIVWRREQDGARREVLRIGQSHLPADGTMRTWHNPTLIPDNSKVHLIYHRNYKEAFVRTSLDGGFTWDEPQNITGVFREFPTDWNVCATGPGHGICMRSGRLVAAVWLANGEPREDGTIRHEPSVSGCIYSDDHGVTWHVGAMTEGLPNANETTMTQLPDGRLLFCIRNEDRRRYLALSANGEHFDKVWPCDELTDPRCFGSLISVDSGVLFGNCMDSMHRQRLGVRYSADAGQTWKTVWEIAQMGGYIDLACVDGRMYAFCEQDIGFVENLSLYISDEINKLK